MGIISVGVSFLHFPRWIVSITLLSLSSLFIRHLFWFQPLREQNGVIVEFVNNLSSWILTDKYFAVLSTSVYSWH